MVSHSASEQFIGYLYQIRYALYMLLVEEDDDVQICIENYDDIAIVKNNSVNSLVQTKSHSGKNGRLTNASVDLWRTIKSWCDVIEENNIDVTKTKFLIITTASAPKDSAAYMLKNSLYTDLESTRDTNKALEVLLNTSSTISNKKNLSFYDKFNKMNDDIRKKLIDNVYVLDNCSNIVNLKPKIMKFINRISLPSYGDKIYERLEGRWFDMIVNCLHQKNSVFIPSMQVRSILSGIRDEYSSDNLPISINKELTPTQEEMKDRDKLFLDQLRLICVTKNRLNTAIKDYYRAYKQRLNWVRDGLLYANDLQDYENILIDEWQRYFDEMCEDLQDYGDNIVESIKQKEGRSLFNKISDKSINIREKCTEPFIMRGSYHMLANKLDVGWHIDFEKRLCKIFKEAGAII
ncbi:ABC-three component system protein [Clostridium tyrobutyricum]|uniref:ABC-three component system protein n=1 Tax=Clostridium tyrobutyricum TaxID=1519 RepID=UPI00057D75CC|nr:ABC-three component system protein [Clostridium tyrobutyricum]